MSSPTPATCSERQPDAFEYLDRCGLTVTGTVWAPGPVSRSVWVMPEGSTRAADAVVVRHPKARRPRYRHEGRSSWPDDFAGWWEDWRITPGGQRYDESVARETTHEAPVSPADWRDALNADSTIMLDFGDEDAA